MTMTVNGALDWWKVGFHTTFPELAERPRTRRTPHTRPESFSDHVAFEIS